MGIDAELLEDLQQMQDTLVARATTNETTSESDFRERRARLLANPALAHLLPDFIRSCRTLGQFWLFIQPKFSSWTERREYIWNEFRPAMDATETGLTSPIEDAVGDTLDRLNADHVRRVWRKAQNRRIDDPEGALTAARALLESVCKMILDALSSAYDDSADLPKLYKLVAKSLNLAPEQHTELVFKQILGGCTSVVEGLGSLRNKMGDAHGKHARAVRPASRHAELAVNLAGAMATFLVATFEARRGALPVEPTDS